MVVDYCIFTCNKLLTSYSILLVLLIIKQIVVIHHAALCRTVLTKLNISRTAFFYGSHTQHFLLRDKGQTF